MAERVVLHIGAMKSGTSFVQGVLSGNRKLLESRGVLFPGHRWRNQVSAVRDLSERGGEGQEPLAPDGPWRRLASEVNAWQGTAVISMEFLGPRQVPKIEEVVRSFPGSTVEAVLTVRDFARTVPAMWQEAVQNAGTATWDDYLEAVRKENTKTKYGRNFWRHQSTSGIAKRWSTVLGKDRFTLVTVPPAGAPPSLLWERFAEAARLEPDGFDLRVPRNPSVGAASALVMRALNERLGADPLPRQVYSRFVKHGLAKTGLAERQVQDRMFGLDEPWVRKLGRREVDRLRKLDLHVIGSLDDLEPLAVPGVSRDSVSAQDQLDAALDGLTHVLRQWAGHKRPEDVEFGGGEE